MSGTKLSIESTSPLSSALPYSIHVSNNGKKNGQIGLANPGFYGIDVKPQTYTGSFYVRGTYNGQFTASLKSMSSGKTLATTLVKGVSKPGRWTQLKYQLAPKAAPPDVKNQLVITYDAAKATQGSLNFNLLSLFPPTYNNRPNGMRPDIMNALKSSNASFLRFPGGNNLEGDVGAGATRWTWNNTIGPLPQRPGRLGDWTYLNTDGLGLNEYFEWCQDLTMEPILAVWDGHYLDDKVTSRANLQPYIDDALNELEYVTGSVSTKYGALRSEHGYPDPWPLKYVEIGNEDQLSSGLSSYGAYRFRRFHDAIRKNYPQLTVISSTADIDTPADTVKDYHIYSIPSDLVDKFSYFDNTSNKTLIGEYSAWEFTNMTRAPFPYWRGTVAEAIFMLGAERNADRILGTTYAPILQNLNDVQWIPDLVSFTADPAETIYSTSLQMLSLLSGTRIKTTRGVTLEGDGKLGPGYWVGGVDAAGKGVMKMAVFDSKQPVPFSVKFAGAKAGATAKLTVLTGKGAQSMVDSVGNNVVTTTTRTVRAGGAGRFKFMMEELSVGVLHAL